MIFRINGEVTSLAWESEKTLAEVISGLNSWAASQGHRVTSLLVNQKVADFWDPKLSVESIQEVELDTIPLDQAWLHEIRVAKEYVQKLIQITQNGNLSSLNPLQEDFPWVSPQLSRLGAEVNDPPWDNPTLLHQKAQSWLACFPDKILQPHLKQLKEWGRWIQQGKDREAMESLQNLSQDLEQLSRLDWGSDVWWKELNTFLEEAAEALTRQDLVLVADLLEYEIVPRLETLST